MKVIVFAADGLIGRQLAERALGRGHTVTALSMSATGADGRSADQSNRRFSERPDQRPDERADERASERLHMVFGDVLAPFSFEHALADQQAVLFALDSDGSDKAHSQGMRNVLAAMAEHNVRRLICLSAGGQTQMARSSVKQRLRGWATLGRRRHAEVHTAATEDDLRLMEVHVRSSGIDWTIVRPARIVDKPGQGRYREGLGYEPTGGAQIAAADVADFMLDQLETDRNIGHAVTIAQ